MKEVVKDKVDQIVIYPNKILEEACSDVKFPISDSDKEIINNMWIAVKSKGVGIAAPQIGHSLNMFIVNMSEEGQESKQYKNPDFLVINPKIIFFSQTKTRMVEGCLSFPDQYGFILRPSNIAVEYFNEDGKKIILKAKGWLSRIIQHEFDHLEGRIFIKHPTFTAVDVNDLEM
jgi:peptide deformylase